MTDYSFIDNDGQRYIYLDIDVMIERGNRFYCTFRYKAPYSFNLSAGKWCANFDGLTDALFERYPTLSHRRDLRIHIEDAQPVRPNVRRPTLRSNAFGHQ